MREESHEFVYSNIWFNEFGFASFFFSACVRLREREREIWDHSLGPRILGGSVGGLLRTLAVDRTDCAPGLGRSLGTAFRECIDSRKRRCGIRVRNSNPSSSAYVNSLTQEVLWGATPAHLFSAYPFRIA